MKTKKKITTKEFIKLVIKRLNFKIEQSGLKTSDISQNLNIDQNKITTLLTDYSKLNYDLINKIALFINMNPLRLYSPVFNESYVRFRGQEDINHFKITNQLEELIYILLANKRMPKVKTKIHFPFNESDFESLDNKMIGIILAERLREYLKLHDQPIEIFQLSYDLGLIPVMLNKIDFEALIFNLDKSNISIALLNNEKVRLIQRFRFTMAHELGHFIYSLLFNTKNYEPDIQISFNSNKNEEVITNSFAATLLLPTNIAYEIETNFNKNTVETKMSEYGVSREVIRYRFIDQSFWDYPKNFDMLNNSYTNFDNWNIPDDFTLNKIIWNNENLFSDSNKDFIKKHIPKLQVEKQYDLFNRY